MEHAEEGLFKSVVALWREVAVLRETQLLAMLMSTTTNVRQRRTRVVSGGRVLKGAVSADVRTRVA